ncbi:DUF3093 domain-containing protein [Pseudactinotalea terrae]|uniref:DUF3093 domain-containing protein n=1 Tax=Pseudactinotalea terrae TaxID=1743262 RepID=UPI0012E1328D|nr:DUF3093 domain-containing protein [Pseudactinotalea terrae]
MITYEERLHPSAAMWLLVPVGTFMAGAATFPLGLPIAVPVGLAVGVGLLVALLASRPRVAVGPDGLHAGKAFLEAEHLGEIEALDTERTRLALGPELRADAWLLHRSWIRTAVRVQVQDRADTTPYWVVSTRRPAELATVLVACRDAAGQEGQAAHSEQTG